MAVVPGAGLTQPPVSLLNTANAFTQKYFVPALIDGFAQPSPSWWRLTRKGRKIYGGAIVYPVVTAEEMTGGAYWGAQVLDTNVVDSVKPAEWEWKFYYQTITIPYTDVILNSGKTGVIDLIKAKEQIAMMSMLQKLSRALYGTSPQNTSNDLDSLVAAVATQNNTYAGIARDTSTNNFWNPQLSTSFGVISLQNLQTAYGTATFGNEEPDTILMTQSLFNKFWGLNVANIRYPDPDQETIRAGFRRHMVFNNAVVLHDYFVPSGDIFMLNTKYIDSCFHEDDYFVVDPFVKPSNQRVLVSGIYVTMNLKVFNPRMQLGITGATGA